MNTIRLLSLASLLALTACTQAAESPREIADAYWQALRNGDVETARSLVSTGSRQAFNDYIDSTGKDGAVGEVELGLQTSRVVTVLYPADTPDDYRAFDTLLVMEDGEWKIDAAGTVIPPTGSSTEPDMDAAEEPLSEALQENIDSMEKSMSEGMQLLNEALREGSQDMGESLLRGMQELNRSLKDSVEQLRQRRQQQTPSPAPSPSPLPPAAEEGEGVI